MQLLALPKPPKKTTITMRQPGGTYYFCSAEHILREDTAGEWAVHQKYAQGKLRFDEFRIALAKLYEED